VAESEETTVSSGHDDILRTQIAEVAVVLLKFKRLVISTGAGVSKESGIPTFRDALHGIWANYDPQQLATPQGFRRNPKLVWDWYQERRAMMAGIQPNPGHVALAELERYLAHVVVITQNIDGLHHQAGSTDVVTLHGDITRDKCFNNCRGDPTLVNIDELDWDRNAGPPKCPYCGAWVRPDVVWYHELLPPGALERASELSQTADVMLVIGTSGTVQPAASLPFLAKRHGAKVIEINPEMTPITTICDWHLSGLSGQIMPRIIAAMQLESLDA
jgi:NAD-dependent deacetylase